MQVALRVVEQLKIFGNLGGDVASAQSLSGKLHVSNRRQKKYQKVDVKFSSTIQYFWVSLLCSKNFVQNCKNPKLVLCRN